MSLTRILFFIRKLHSKTLHSCSRVLHSQVESICSRKRGENLGFARINQQPMLGPEEGDEVVLITCRVKNPDLDMVNGSVKEKLENFSNELYEMRFDLETGLASQKKLSVSAVDFPRIKESYTDSKSLVHVIDAKRMSADPVAVVELPNRVSYGFHVFFITEAQNFSLGEHIQRYECMLESPFAMYKVCWYTGGGGCSFGDLAP